MKPDEVVEPVSDYRLRFDGLTPVRAELHRGSVGNFSLLGAAGERCIMSSKRFYTGAADADDRGRHHDARLSQLYISLGDEAEDGSVGADLVEAAGDS
jgi:cytochrome c-type biogenesis protein CcmF